LSNFSETSAEQLKHIPLGIHNTWAYVDAAEAVRLLELSIKSRLEIEELVKS
jgi:hypothetical protein